MDRHRPLPTGIVLRKPRPAMASTLRPAALPAIWKRFYRYFFYGWRFKDADFGSSWERSAALRHNCAQARWLPFYMFRWLVAGTALLALELLAEFELKSPLASALLAVLLTFAVMFQLVTAICWAFLQGSRQSRR